MKRITNKQRRLIEELCKEMRLTCEYDLESMARVKASQVIEDLLAMKHKYL